MKLTTAQSAAAWLLLASNVIAAPYDKRQEPAKEGEGVAAAAGIDDKPPGMDDFFKQLTPVEPFKVENVKPLLSRPGAKRMRITYGPFDILNYEKAKDTKAPLKMDPGSTTFLHIAQGFPKDVMVLSTNTSIAMENGQLATIGQGIYNHHTVFYDKSKSTPIVTDCPAKPAEERAKAPKSVPVSILAGTSEDSQRSMYSSGDGMFNSGYYLSKDPSIVFMGEVINYKNYTQKVYAVTDVEYVEGKPKDALEAFQMVLSVNMCAPMGEKGMPKDLEIPRGQSKARLKSDPIVISRDGYLLYTKGHLHDGGSTILLKVNGKVICESKATYGGEGQEFRGSDGKLWSTLSSMSDCGEPVKLSKGDKLEIDAFYDFEAHPARKHSGGTMGEAEVMGIFGAGFAPLNAS